MFDSFTYCFFSFLEEDAASRFSFLCFFSIQSGYSTDTTLSNGTRAI